MKFMRPATLEPGVYEATLKSVKDDLRKAFQSEEMEEVICFEYIVTDGEGNEQILKRSVKPIIASRSNLLKDLRGMMGAKALEAVQGYDDALSTSIQGLIGKTFLLQTDLSENGYCKIISVMAKPAAKSGNVNQPKTTTKVQDDPDDIPF